MRTDDPLHFQSGFWARAAKLFQAAETWGDPYEETVVLPAFVSWIALHLSERHKIDGSTAAYIFLASTILSGIWLGISWNFTKFIRVVLRGMSVGLLTAALVFLTTSEVFERQEAVRQGANFVVLALFGYTMGFYSIGPFRDIALTTERQWQIGAERRRRLYGGLRGIGLWGLDVLRMIVGTRKMEGATLLQGIITHLIRWVIGAFAAYFAAKLALGFQASDLRNWWTQLRG